MRRKADERREVSADHSLFLAAAVAERVAVACWLLLASRAGFHYTASRCVWKVGKI